jgi:hypothetical protein
MLPGLISVIHHSKSGIVCLIVVHVQEAESCPVLVTLALANDTGDVHAPVVACMHVRMLVRLAMHAKTVLVALAATNATCRCGRFCLCLFVFWQFKYACLYVSH